MVYSQQLYNFSIDISIFTKFPFFIIYNVHNYNIKIIKVFLSIIVIVVEY